MTSLLITMAGNLAGVFSSLLFQPKYGPTYTIPFFITLALVSVSFAGYAIFRRLILAENKNRKAMLESWTESEVEAERMYGKGPSTHSRGSGLFTLAHRVAGPAFVERLKRKLESDGRRGDERITFQYGT
jgi:hypothetical protein